MASLLQHPFSVLPYNLFLHICRVIAGGGRAGGEGETLLAFWKSRLFWEQYTYSTLISSTLYAGGGA